jgi:hypothetical protein
LAPITRQQPVLLAAADAVDAVARRLGPARRVDLGGAQVGKGAFVAELADLLVEERILLAQPVEIGLGDDEQERVGLGAHRRRARAAAQQRHLAERLAFAQRREYAAVAVQHLDLAIRHDVERIAGIAGAEHDLGRRHAVLGQMFEHGLHVCRRQVAQHLAFRELGEVAVDFLALALERILQELRRIAQRGAVLLEEQRGHEVDHRAEEEAAGDRDPGGMHVGAVLGELVRALEGELDGERRDQRAGSEGEDSRLQLVGDRQVEAERRAHHHRARGEEAEQRHLEDGHGRDGHRSPPLCGDAAFLHRTGRGV